MIPRLETKRLILREWRAGDFEAYAAWCADPDVMKFLGGVMERNDAWRVSPGRSGTGHCGATACGRWNARKTVHLPAGSV